MIETMLLPVLNVTGWELQFPADTFKIGSNMVSIMPDTADRVI
jgi:hypothetical protein